MVWKRIWKYISQIPPSVQSYCYYSKQIFCRTTEANTSPSASGCSTTCPCKLRQLAPQRSWKPLDYFKTKDLKLNRTFRIFLGSISTYAGVTLHVHFCALRLGQSINFSKLPYAWKLHERSASTFLNLRCTKMHDILMCFGVRNHMHISKVR